MNPAGGRGIPPTSVGAPDRRRKMFQGSPLTWHLSLPEKAWAWKRVCSTLLATMCPYMGTDQLPHQVGSSPSACLFTSSKGAVSVYGTHRRVGWGFQGSWYFPSH